MKKSFILIFVLILISCVSNKKSEYTEFNISNNAYVQDSSITIDEQWLPIWHMLTSGDFESLSSYIDKNVGLRVSDTLFISDDYDIVLTQDDIKHIREVKFDYYDIRLEQRRMTLGTEIFKLYESYHEQKIDKVGYNTILVDKNLSIYNNLKHIEEKFPKENIIIDIFFDADVQKGYLWKHFFMIVGYVDNKMVLYGLTNYIPDYEDAW